MAWNFNESSEPVEISVRKWLNSTHERHMIIRCAIKTRSEGRTFDPASAVVGYLYFHSFMKTFLDIRRPAAQDRNQ